jgi:pimeloyl-ACP methyl ester carboxylesterase
MAKSNGKFADVHEDGGLRGYEPEFVDVNGTRTRYYNIGDETNDTLVLVHGGNWGGLSNANTWAASFEHLAEEFQVVAFDRIGCGMTDNPDDVEDYRYLTELRHALDFLETMGIDSCHIAGSSRGGGLATRMSVEQPERFDSLIMLNSATFGPPTGDQDFRYDRIFERFADDFEPTDPEYTRFRYIQYAHQTEYITDEFCRTNAYIRSLEKAQKTAEIMEGGGQQEVWERTMREQMREAQDRIRDGILQIPMLYVFGRNDLTVPFEMAMSAYDMIAQKNDRTRMKVFNNCGHLIYREYPEEFAKTIVNFTEQWN